MATFEFYSAGRIIFGRGQSARIGEFAGQFGRSALIVANAGQPGDGGPIDRIAERLRTAGVASTVLRQRGEPTVADVDGGVAVAREHSCELVVGLGGGSAIDAAKAIAGLLTNGGSALDYLEVGGDPGQRRKITQPAAPWIAMPTTAGTGAEVTRNAVIGCPSCPTCPGRGVKASIRSEHLLARVALIDPELGVSVRPDVTARAGLDALCQLIEAYTSTAAQPITDSIAMAGIRLAGPWLGRAYADGTDLEARESMAMAAMLSGIALTNAGLGAVHGLAAPMGANFPAPHGAVCAALLPHVMRANVAALRRLSPDHPTLQRYVDIGRAMTGRGDLQDAAAIEAGIDFCARLTVELRIGPLGEFGFSQHDVTPMVAQARRSSSMKFNPVVLSDDALAEVLAKAM